MFGLFKKKSEVEKLQEKYGKLMKEWHALSSTNRSESDMLKQKLLQNKLIYLKHEIS